ncbi:hypothetical protein GobsT_07470 [Gemmata obscuriglobus]|uniref:hypothetical protein n=1 Tax=Gemmata obscuriglobus TaxID=114 RepID=UPI0011CD347A|nr:hypothetical protein [Gemmata obscuriglobus]QEG26012.1 hypothetical protein GobsT_07470 [Gemmata obscuriglobus]VTS00317.1 unnamed protein product [Gemmata obscuriglobus UQM 2246]
MRRLGATLRFLAVALCLVPFTSSQQARAALLPVVPVPAAPDAPTNEEEEQREERGEREESAAKARHTFPYRNAEPIRELVATLPPAHAMHYSHVAKPRTTPPSAADPFRNGLGAPYRC